MDEKEKKKEAMNRFEKIMMGMTERELENLLLVGEGMVIMSGIKSGLPVEEAMQQVVQEGVRKAQK